jgi:hypothetical protein
VLALSYQNSSASTTATATTVWENVTTLVSDATHDLNLEVRSSYFGICASQNGRPFICQDTAKSLAASRFDDPLGLIEMAGRYQSDVLFPGLL